MSHGDRERGLGKIDDSDKPVPAPTGARERDDLDLFKPGDRRLLAESIRRGWQIDPERKARYFKQLDEVIASADPKTPEGAAAIIGASRILQYEQAAALKDLHRREARRRLDAGKSTANVKHEVAVVKAPPDYDALRRRMLGQ